MCVPCMCVFVCVRVSSDRLLLAECVFNIRWISTRCIAMQTVLSIPLRLSLMSLIGWGWHTPGSLGLSQEPEGWRHNVYTVDRAQMCLCLYLNNSHYFGKISLSQMVTLIPLSCLFTKYGDNHQLVILALHKRPEAYSLALSKCNWSPFVVTLFKCLTRTG